MRELQSQRPLLRGRQGLRSEASLRGHRRCVCAGPGQGGAPKVSPEAAQVFQTLSQEWWCCRLSSCSRSGCHLRMSFSEGFPGDADGTGGRATVGTTNRDRQRDRDRQREPQLAVTQLVFCVGDWGHQGAATSGLGTVCVDRHPKCHIRGLFF